MSAIVFDMDGLLLNTEDLYDLVIGELLAESGHSFGRDCKRAMMGRPSRDALTILRDTYSLDASVEQLADRIELGLKEILPTHLQLMPGVQELFEFLDRHGVRSSVATSSRRTFAEMALHEARILERFQFLICGGEVERGKPAPDIYLESARRHRTESQRIVVFEDSVNGCRAAVSSGATTVVVPGSHNADQHYEGPELIVDQIDDAAVFDLLERWLHRRD